MAEAPTCSTSRAPRLRRVPYTGASTGAIHACHAWSAFDIGWSICDGLTVLMTGCAGSSPEAVDGKLRAAELPGSMPLRVGKLRGI